MAGRASLQGAPGEVPAYRGFRLSRRRGIGDLVRGVRLPPGAGVPPGTRVPVDLEVVGGAGCVEADLVGVLQYGLLEEVQGELRDYGPMGRAGSRASSTHSR